MRTTKEQPSGFLEVFEEEVTLPCAATILDAEVEVLVLDGEGMNVKVESLAVAEEASASQERIDTRMATVASL